MARAFKSLPELVDDLQSRGRYAFVREEAEALGFSRIAIKNAVRRLVARRRVAVPRRGFYVIVPLEYRVAGAPPASWFIDDFMHAMARPYYVGLLTAASIHGAAHHGPQEFQVLTTLPLRPITIGRGRLRFFVNRHLDRTPVFRARTETGTMVVSTPAGTALDLVRYVGAAGQLSNVATVLAELSERLDPTELTRAATSDTEVTVVQRLGYLLERAGQARLAAPLADWLSARRPRPVALNPSLEADGPTVQPWQVLENDVVELDA